MAIEPKTGPFTLDELLALWLSVTDPAYTQPLVQLGEGEGLEVFTQQHQQLKRVSEAIDRTMQAMFILPWSGQSDEPASGASRATVELTVTRTGRFDIPITFVELLVEEEQEDYEFAQPQGVQVLTGRRYGLVEPLTFAPGEAGPKTVEAIAEREGFGYNNPLPATITSFVQPGTGFTNIGATVIPGVVVHRLQVSPIADVVIPEHVGQYIEFTAGANAGQVRRVVAFEPSNPAVPHGGIAVLAKTVILNGTFAAPGDFILNEDVVGGTSGAIGNFVYATATLLILERVTGTFIAGEAVTGVLSAATGTLDGTVPIAQDGELVAEVATAVWQVLDWEDDLSFEATNDDSPTGGCAPMLDELGGERNVPRAPGEADDDYRERIARLPDTVSPNAIRRAGNRIVAPFGSSVCLREVGDIDNLFPGMFYDVATTPTQVGFAYDMNESLTLSAGFFGYIPSEPLTQPGGFRARAGVGYTLPGTGTPFLRTMVDIEGVYDPTVAVTGEWSGVSIVLGPATPSRSQDRFRLAMSYAESRAFFLIGVPPLALGEFGIPYDAVSTPINAYDAYPFLAFYDGFALTSAVINRSIWQAIDKIKAGGVGFDLYVENLGCF